MCRSILQTSRLCKYVCISIKELCSLNLLTFVVYLLKFKLSKTAPISPLPPSAFMFSQEGGDGFFLWLNMQFVLK